mgnify:CR=1 FL=1
MNIGVLIKQVPSSESPVPLHDSEMWIQEDGVNWEMNDSDSYALEEALLIKEKQGGGDVVVITLGPEARSLKTIREALAKGADRAIHLVDDVPGLSDPYLIASAIAHACKEESLDLVLSGLQSGDLASGQVGILVGEILGMTTSSLVMETDFSDNSIRVKRELEGGWYQWVELPLPAAINVQSGLNHPRYASLKGIMSAKRKEIKTIPVADALNNTEALQSMSTLSVPIAEKRTEMIEGDTDQIVSKLIDIMKTKAKVL